MEILIKTKNNLNAHFWRLPTLLAYDAVERISNLCLYAIFTFVQTDQNELTTYLFISEIVN